MELLILKSAVCLAILMVFYKLFLERLAIHKFKRFYLLGALVVSIVIPFITFIEYIEPVSSFGTFDPNVFGTPPYFPADILIEEPTNYLPIILWSIYGLGVLLFTIKFCVNLFGIISKINKNEKRKHKHFISVLLHDFIVPHTFFSYIFLNKSKFEAKEIPQEVLLHEQTHANQKHSLDILFIELFQITFWFNPLLYFIKKDIKLNHEFLADDAVLKQGIDQSTYQKTLLQFASNANSIPLAHAINYSLIKKRFTIMKTKTSKKAVWLRSLLLIPLLGGLLFSFSGREQVEKEVVPAMVFPEERQNNNALTEVKEELAKTNNLKKNYIETNIKNDSTIIEDVVVLITKKEELFLNDKATTLKSLKVEINKLNTNLTTKQKQKFVYGKIFHHKNTSKALIEIINNIFKESNIWSFMASNLDLKVNGKFPNITAPDLPFMTMENLSKDDKKIYRYKINSYKNWLEKNNSKNKLEITKKGYFLRNKNNEIIISYDPDYKAVLYPTANEKKSPWKIKLSSVTYTEDSNSQKPSLTINGIVCDGCKLNLTKKAIEDIKLGTTTGVKISSFTVKVPGNSPENIKGNTLNAKAISYLKSSKLGATVTLFHIKTNNKEELPHITISLVNKNETTSPPPPPPPKVLTIEKPQLPPPPPPAPETPPAPPSKNDIIGSESGFSKYIMQMEKNGDAIFYNNKKITSKKALALYKRYGKLDILVNKIAKGKHQVFLKEAKGVASTIKSQDLTNVPPPPPPPAPTSDIKSSENNSKKCLSISNVLNFNEPNTRLKINCIKDYPENKLSVFNKWGVLIYSKKGYNNSWNGSADKKFADTNGKVHNGTYYYVLDYNSGKESLSGSLQIENGEKTEKQKNKQIKP